MYIFFQIFFLLLIIGSFVGYGSFKGMFHAVTWSLKGGMAFDKAIKRIPKMFKNNEHKPDVIERAFFVGGMFFMFCLMKLVYWLPIFDLWTLKILLGMAAGICFFTYCHTYFMYDYRNRIDGSYPQGGHSEPSDSSTAKINLTQTQRILILLTGASILIIDVFLIIYY